MFALADLEITMFSQIIKDQLKLLGGSLKFIGPVSRMKRKLAVCARTFDLCQSGKIRFILSRSCNLFHSILIMTFGVR